MKTKQKSENQKALPKFLCIIFGCFVFGFVVSMFINFYDANIDKDSIVEMLHHFMIVASPYIIWITTVLIAIISNHLYVQSKMLFGSWNQEDEEMIYTAEHKLDIALLLSNINLFVAFAFLPSIFLVLKTLSTATIIRSIVILIGFILAIVITTIIQQKVVDLTCIINPEKKGSVYDVNFKKNWLRTCDEQEIARIGNASFKAFSAMSTSCIIIWLIQVLIYAIFETGLFSIFLTIIILAVGHIVYVFSCMKSKS